ncbi:MAG: hypothetical protein ABUT39_11460, partial [Acidobacteriota bacterium]
LAYLRKRLSENSKDSRLHSAIGLVHAALHEKDEAVQEGVLGVSLCDDAALQPYRTLDLASIYLSVGERDHALEQIQRLLSIPSPLSVALLRVDPRWDLLREDPRFEQILAGRSESP